MLVLALVPFVSFVGLLFGLKWSMLRSTWVALGITALLAVFYWGMEPVKIGQAIMKGSFGAADILVIVFGALFFLKILEGNKTIEHLCRYLESVSKDYRVQTILLAWFLESFLEGLAGFGTPLTIVAPLLVGIGLSPMTAVVVALVGNSTAGMFGAVGTPIRVGFSDLDITGVAQMGARFNFIGVLIPVFMLILVTAGRKDRWQELRQALPLAIFSGLAMTGTALLVAGFAQEMATIVGSLVGLLVVLFTLKWWSPKDVISLGGQATTEKMPLGNVILPYLLLVVLLAAGKVFLGSSGVIWSWGVVHKFAFYNPGWAFLITGVLVCRGCGKSIAIAAKSAAMNSWLPFLVISGMSGLVQTMNYSGMVLTIARSIALFWLPIMSPFLGAFGAFLTGSVTVSNVMFGEVLATAAATAGFGQARILALQLVGATAGNMIAIADVLPAEAVLGLKGREREVIGKVAIFCLVYVVLAVTLWWV